ncbi:hypothetical protein GGX14DRAFT_467985 [Mycena pura]|uniref:Uncharacterized protein n=1 Tax=Mycena pura TaxID=153505 RepID=A0AAD6V7Q1_9AGAR|nr:hypothetical protein GGX14DRAFT_467985 [Mycena pura]
MPRTPPETNDIIIDHLHDDVSTLRQCSLVCKEWLPAARFHIFSVVHLSLYSIDQMIEVLFYPGSPMPHRRPLAQYIRDLHIIDGEGREFDPKWINDKLSLVTLSSMTSILSLSLDHVDFSGLSGASMAALRGITARVTRLELAHVRFKDFTGCLAFLEAAVSLKSLTSCVTSFEDEIRSPRSIIDTILPELVELNLESDDDSLLDLVSSMSSPPRIRAVSLYLGENNISTVAGLLARLGSSLTHLQIRSFSLCRTLPSGQFFHNFSYLITHCNIIFRPNTWQFIVQILDTAAPTLAIKRVYMQLPQARHYFDFPSLSRIFMAEGSALRRAELVLTNLDHSGICSASIEWLETMGHEACRIYGRTHEVSLRDFRPEYGYV